MFFAMFCILMDTKDGILHLLQKDVDNDNIIWGMIYLVISQPLRQRVIVERLAQCNEILICN